MYIYVNIKSQHVYIMYAYTMQAMQMGPEYSDTMEEEILKIRIDKADKYLRHAMNLLQLVRRAPASRFPCFPVLLNSKEDTVNLDMEAKVCPLLRDRAHRFEEESALLSLEPRAEDADGGSGARKEMEEIAEHKEEEVSKAWEEFREKLPPEDCPYWEE